MFGNPMSGTARYFIEICFSQLKAIQQLSFLLDTEAQSLPTCLYLFVSKLTYTTGSRVIDFAVTIESEDSLHVRYLKARGLRSVLRKA